MRAIAIHALEMSNGVKRVMCQMCCVRADVGIGVGHLGGAFSISDATATPGKRAIR